MIALCVICWATSEWSRLRCERLAKAVLEHDYHAAVICPINGDGPNWIWDKESLSFDLHELLRGRLYVPVTIVSFSKVTVDFRAAKQLALLQRLEHLALQDCHVEHDVKFPPTILSLKSLELWDTPITAENLRCISQLRHLEYLIVDATGLKGDWLRDVSTLPKLRNLLLNNGDLSGVPTDSLGRMTGLTSLQLSSVKINSKLGFAIARLEDLETLVVVDTPFDDNDMKHLVGLKRLRDLVLIGTEVTNHGMASLQKLPNLRRLSLANNKVGDDGLRHLVHLPNLTGLDIRQTQATNSCLRTLAAIASLKTVLVEGTRISKSSTGFHGVLRDGIWYRDMTKAIEHVKGEDHAL